MTLSDLSIKNPVFAWMLMAALMIFGLFSYSRLGVSQLPDVDFPVVSVSLSWEGAAPEVMETDIVDIVEDSVMGIQGVHDVSSSIKQGAATVTIEFELNKNIDIAVQEVENKISQAERSLPKEMDKAIVSKVNPQDRPIMFISVSSATLPLRDIMAYVQDHLKDQFSTISGVGDIFLGGFQERNLRIWVDADKLNAAQLTVQDVIDAVTVQHQEIPAGRIETEKQEFNLRVMGEAVNTQDFGNIIIPNRAGRPIFKPIYLKDVASIEDGLADIRRIVRFKEKPGVGLGITKQRGANEIAVAEKVLKRLEEIRSTIPPEIKVEVAYDSTRFSKDSINELLFTLILSALVTSLVCWIFLGSWTATLNILLAIPTSILGAFIVIYFLGFTLNTFTVLGLSLAIGIVVDDAIMVLENIVRYREEGEEKVEAAIKGARQITFAALATTVALIAIFLPVAFMSGVIGRFFFQYGMTISIAVALSLLEALTLTPMRCSQFLQVGKRATKFGQDVEKSFRWLREHYAKALVKALDHRIMVVLIALVCFLGSLFFIRILRKEFLPSQDQSLFFVRVQTPEGSSITFTDQKFKKIEEFIRTRPEVKMYFELIGGFVGGDVNSGALFVTFKQPKDRPIVPPNKHRLSQAELMALFRKELNKIPDLKAIIQDLSQYGFSAQRGFPIELSIRGPDWEKLAQYSQQIIQRMKKSSLMTDVDTDYQARIPEIRILPDRVKANERGVDINTIGNAINALVGGQRVGKYTNQGRRYDIRIRLIPSQRSTVEDLDRLWVWNNRGELVQLKNAVAVTEKPTPLAITRRNRERSISIFANVATGKSQTDAIEEINQMSKEILPGGYRAIFSGSTQTFQESFASLIVVLLMGVLVAYMVLASQFNSYVNPTTVLFALPFSVSGAFISLWLARQSLNIYSLIGLILLMGIVKKNSILLVDFTNQMREQGLELRPALLKACPIRLRPILMTSMATVTAAIPPALALGPERKPEFPWQ